MKNMDDILNQALTPEHEPDYRLIQTILAQTKEAAPMKKTRPKYAAVFISCLLAIGIVSVSVYAAWTYLKPDQLVRDWGESRLADAFLGEGTVYINETQSCGGYDVTLLGITSGKNLTNYQYSAGNGVGMLSTSGDISVITDSEDTGTKEPESYMVPLTDRSYAVFAIESEHLGDGPFYDGFNIFPVVMGYDYETYRSMFEEASGGHYERKGDTLYYMYECNNLELFADRDIYLCVSDDLPSLSEYSYIYNNDSGILARNVQYEGLNALFHLPLDASKADPDAAAQKTAAWEKQQQETQQKSHSDFSPMSDRVKAAFDFVEQITPENIDEYATPLTGDDALMTFVPDAQGRIDVKLSYAMGGEHWKAALKDLFPDGKKAAVSYTNGSGSDPDTILLEYLTLNEDGTVTLQMYAPNLPE